ncbi:hypothetical protein B14911_10927 [Bacillus sp. NRRL B-14911]|nr:hypothetical protein B14911_10927 [Bacillus sp. NRRL B-14911]
MKGLKWYSLTLGKKKFVKQGLSFFKFLAIHREEAVNKQPLYSNSQKNYLIKVYSFSA